MSKLHWVKPMHNTAFKDRDNNRNFVVE